ncbi:uncharacterized protein LOC135682839 [Rhopilema esculentum]|uniref:uncharacterized protein LOC135682839 n=1 Tax=Rhopilema esculentum TaxID=499914 RepID=UPI0031D8978B
MAAFFCPYCFLYEKFQNSVELEWHVLKKHGEHSLVSLLKSRNRTPGSKTANYRKDRKTAEKDNSGQKKSVLDRYGELKAAVGIKPFIERGSHNRIKVTLPPSCTGRDIDASEIESPSRHSLLSENLQIEKLSVGDGDVAFTDSIWSHGGAGGLPDICHIKFSDIFRRVRRFLEKFAHFEVCTTEIAKEMKEKPIWQCLGEKMIETKQMVLELKELYEDWHGLECYMTSNCNLDTLQVKKKCMYCSNEATQQPKSDKLRIRKGFEEEICTRGKEIHLKNDKAIGDKGALEDENICMSGNEVCVQRQEAFEDEFQNSKSPLMDSGNTKREFCLFGNRGFIGNEANLQRMVNELDEENFSLRREVSRIRKCLKDKDHRRDANVIKDLHSKLQVAQEEKRFLAEQNSKLYAAISDNRQLIESLQNQCESLAFMNQKYFEDLSLLGSKVDGLKWEVEFQKSYSSAIEERIVDYVSSRRKEGHKAELTFDQVKKNCQFLQKSLNVKNEDLQVFKNARFTTTKRKQTFQDELRL